MARPLAQLEKLSESVASALDQYAPERARAIEDARHRFLEAEFRVGARQRSRSLVKPLWAFAATAALAAAGAAFMVRRSTPLHFQVDGAAGVAKTWLAAPGALPVRLEFSEGTKVRLEAASRARVVDIDAHGASFALESGGVHAEVVHKSDAVWKVIAGPFTVNVTGTIFDVKWDPKMEQLSVSVARGSVLVRDALTGSEQAVRTSQTLRSNSLEHRSELLQTSSEGVLPPSVASLVTPASSAPEAQENRASPADAQESKGSASPDGSSGPSNKNESTSLSAWQKLAKHGGLREAFASAEAAGFSRVCASASPTELLMLGDGARLSGKPAPATEALLTLRRRYPSDPRVAAAAFALGKVAFDQRGAYERAAAWFSTSLREQPNGPLAREASGRLIEALRRADDSAGARRAARDYLSKYPAGPHADLARSLL